MSRSAWRQPVRIADAVSAAIQGLGLDERFRHHEIWRVWSAAVGPQIARHAEPHGLWHGRLVVHVTDPVWLHHLSMMRHRLIAALNERLRGSVIREMSLRIGEVQALPATPPSERAAPSRAPRPDPDQLSRIEELLAPLGDAPFRDALYRLLLRACHPPRR